MTRYDYLLDRVNDESLVEFSKAARDKEYRSSNLAFLNPRSKTEVKRGGASMARRGGRWLGGSMIGGSLGGLGGAVAGRKGASIGGTLGGAVGGSIGRTYNLKSGDTRARLRSDPKKKAQAAADIPGVGSFWSYRRPAGGR